MSTSEQFVIHQIFYDESSKRMLDPGFVPLDNTSNERPDWYEFWVIREFLLNTVLQEDTWYGIFSPKFRHKTGLDATSVLNFVEYYSPSTDVAIFSPGWDQIAYFQNPFEQGDFWHPGLLDLSQQFLVSVGIDVDLRTLVTDSSTTVFSNYVVAKAAFWREWLRIANFFFDYVEYGREPLSVGLRSTTSYGSADRQRPMKVFIQERFASLVLACGNFRVKAIDLSGNLPIFTRLFCDDVPTRRLLHTCELLKRQYRATHDEDYRRMYTKIRALVPTAFDRLD
jgi:hypothetical protein